MSGRAKIVIGVVTFIVLVTILTLRTINEVSIDYVPIVMDYRQTLIADPSLGTPDQLDRVERVLVRYGEKHKRLSPTRLQISLRLHWDKDLLWNYTTKSGDDRFQK